MYKNLKAEIARAGLTNPEMAGAVGMSYMTMWRLMNGKQQFRLGEMVAIQSKLEERNGEDYTLDYLFGDGHESGEGESDQGAHDSSVRPD